MRCVLSVPFTSDLISLLAAGAAPQIFITLGMAQTASLLGIIIVSTVNILATLIAIYAVDRCSSCSIER
jgi:hypothetical protein